MPVRNAFFHISLWLALSQFSTIYGQEEIQLDTSDCIRKKPIYTLGSYIKLA